MRETHTQRERDTEWQTHKERARESGRDNERVRVRVRERVREKLARISNQGVRNKEYQNVTQGK